MLDYTYEDLKLVFQFAKDNPELTLEDWIKVNNKTLTDDERKMFKFVEMVTINVPSKSSKDNHLYLINWDGAGGGWFSQAFKVFKRKYFEEYYEFYNMEYAEHSLITPDEDFFNTENYNNSENFKGVFETTLDVNGAIITITNHSNLEGDDLLFDRFDRWKRYMDRKHTSFWNDGSWDIYIENIEKLEFKPILDLFEPEKK